MNISNVRSYWHSYELAGYLPINVIAIIGYSKTPIELSFGLIEIEIIVKIHWLVLSITFI